ncbi:MAG: TldD/PmbA family protein [Candidatus Bathyarchaeia archaeon]
MTYCMEDIIGLLETMLDKIESSTASYGDVRFQRLESEFIQVDNKKLKDYSSGTLSGIGVRVINNGAIGFASTSDLSLSGLERVLKNSLDATKGRREEDVFPLGDRENSRVDVGLPMKVDPWDIPPEEKVELTLDANKAAWIDDKVKNATTLLGLTKDQRVYMSTDGAEVKVFTPLVGLAHTSIAEEDGVKEVIRYSESLCSGYEFIEEMDWNSFTADISHLTLQAVAAETASPGTYPVVVDNDVVGLVLHEALGHATEGDIVSKGGSVLRGRLGSDIASELVSIYDEGVVDSGYFYPYDDEGTEKGRTALVEEGILKGYLADRRSAKSLEQECTGNGRAQDFENFTLTRQTNYYMEPGDNTREELVEGIDEGILVQGKGMRGGQVDTAMGTFTFGVGPSRIIRDGVVCELVRGVVISGSILEVLKSVDAVGRDFKIRTGVFGGCGKGAQTVKTGMGGPSIRAEMTVGGQ